MKYSSLDFLIDHRVPSLKVIWLSCFEMHKRYYVQLTGEREGYEEEVGGQLTM